MKILSCMAIRTVQSKRWRILQLLDLSSWKSIFEEIRFFRSGRISVIKRRFSEAKYVLTSTSPLNCSPVLQSLTESRSTVNNSVGHRMVSGGLNGLQDLSKETSFGKSSFRSPTFRADGVRTLERIGHWDNEVDWWEKGRHHLMAWSEFAANIDPKC